MKEQRRTARSPRLWVETALTVVALAGILVSLAVPTGQAHGQQAATITLGRPIEVDLIPPGTITANGMDQVLAFVVTDEMGGLAEDVRFRGSSVDFGRLTEWARIAPGMYTCIYTPPDNSQVRQATLKVKVKVGNGTAEKSFTLLLEPSPVARFAFEATPAQLVLSRDPNSSLVFTATGPDGGPLDGLNLQVNANAGSVQNVQGLGGGKYGALYTPPVGEIAPKLAIVSVTDADHPETAVGFFSIPLIGNIAWQVNTGMANVNVLMDVAGQRFGPFLSDASGMATVPILVPPGVSTATATVVMPDGTSTPPQPVDLMVPPFKHLKLAAPPSYLPGDGAYQAPVYVYAVDALGAPTDNVDVQLAASHGGVGLVRPLGGGLYQAVYTAGRVDAATPVTLTATLPGAPQDVDVVSFELVPPLPGALALASDPAGVPAGDAAVQLTGTLTLGMDAAPDFHGVNFFTSAGAIQGVTPQGGGVYIANYGGNFDQRTVIAGMAAVPALTRAPEAVVAWPIDDQVGTNSNTVIVAMAVDRYGIPVTGVPLTAQVLEGGGKVTGGGTTDGAGRVVFSFRAAPLAGLSLVHISGAGLSFTCPVWQTQSPVAGFEFPVAGGLIQAQVLTTWAPLRARLVMGGQGMGPATAPVVTTGVTTPVVTSGTASPWGTPATTTPAEPATTTPAEPVTTTPAEPVTTTPAEPVTTTPAEPVTTTPVEPVTTTPVEPATTTPAAGPPARIEVLAMPGTLPRDGASVSNVLVKVVDASGRPVPDEQVVIVASGGVLSNKVDNGDGTFTAQLTAPRGGTDAQVNISASRLQGDLSAFAVIALTAPASDKPTRVRAPRTPREPQDHPYRTARAMFHYPLAGYAYDMEPGNCGDAECTYFPDMDVVGGGGGGLVGVPESFSLRGEVFPIEYVGAHARFARYGYRTDYSVTTTEGQPSVFRDGMYHVIVGATGRLPLLKQHTVGPLDVLLHLGYHAQDVVVFHGHGDEDDAWTWENLWLHGFRLGLGVRFQVAFAQIHAGWAGSMISSGLAANELTFGASFRIWKGLTLDAHYQYMGRHLQVTSGQGEVQQSGDITEKTHGLLLGAGWSF